MLAGYRNIYQAPALEDPAPAPITKGRGNRAYAALNMEYTLTRDPIRREDGGFAPGVKFGVHELRWMLLNQTISLGAEFTRKDRRGNVTHYEVGQRRDRQGLKYALVPCAEPAARAKGVQA